jgi:cell division protein FtsN
MAEDGFHEIQLGGKQLVFLFMTATVVLVAAFLLGVQVGRGARGSQSIDASSVEALSTATPPPAASTPSQPAASSGPPAAEPPAPAPEADDDLSYAKRLQGDSAPSEKLKSPPASAARASADTSPAPAPARQASTPKAAAPPSAPKADAAAASAGQPGAWVVQLVALKDRGEASAMANRLAAKGYPAFVLDPSAGAPTIYRVQVGGFPDREHADQTERRIEKEEKMQGYVHLR